jgi:hypothetical protein
VAVGADTRLVNVTKTRFVEAMTDRSAGGFGSFTVMVIGADTERAPLLSVAAAVMV